MTDTADATATSLRLLDLKAPTDFLISYVTDLEGVVEKMKTWLADNHRDGQAFVDQTAGPSGELLKVAADADREKLEAEAATTAQDNELAKGVKVTRDVRRIGRWVASELDEIGDDQSTLQALQVRTCTGIGVRVDLNRQSGLRRLLTVQASGLPKIASILTEWKQPADLLDRVTTAKARIKAAIEKQSSEQIDADLALDAVEMKADKAIKGINRILRLVNARLDDAPAESVTALRSLEGDHPNVWNRSSGSGGE